MIPPIAGTPEDTQTDHAECGSLACISVLEIVGAGTTPVENNSSAETLAGVVARPGVVTQVVSGNLADVVARYSTPGVYVIGLVHCTGNAVPSPTGTASHWVAIYDPTGSYYQVWTATFQPGGWDMRGCSNGDGPHLIITLEVIVDALTEILAKVTDIWNMFFMEYGAVAGTPKWSNLESMRRSIAQLGASYQQGTEFPYVPGPNPLAALFGGGTGFTPAQIAAIAEIPAIATALAAGDLTLAHIEAALKGA